MPRFVILYHDYPESYERDSHWDLMFEADGVLRTWAVGRLLKGWQPLRELTAATFAECPKVSESDAVSAEALGDHRLAYLEYEGAVSGDRGRVKRIETGDYTTVFEAPDRWTVSFSGQILEGEITLTRQSTNSTEWQLDFRQI